VPVALAVIFYGVVEYYVNVAILIALIAIELAALLNCLGQRADAFPVVGSLSKNAWTGILLASVLVTAGCWFFTQDNISIFAFAAITAAAVYMLDVRPALRDASSGSGGW